VYLSNVGKVEGIYVSPCSLPIGDKDFVRDDGNVGVAVAHSSLSTVTPD